MDQASSHIKQDLKDILETRVAISEKLELLEREAEATMEHTKTAVIDMVDHARETVTDVMEKTKRTLDPTHYMKERPWMMLGGAIALGYLASLAVTKVRPSGVYPYYPPCSDGPPVMPSVENAVQTEEGVYSYYPEEPQPAGRHTAGGPALAFLGSSLWQALGQEFAGELHHAKSALIHAGRGLIRDLSRQIVPSVLGLLLAQSRPDRSKPEEHSVHD